MRSLVVVPTYNEGENLTPLLRAVLAVAPEADVLVVDDASPDGTGALAALLTLDPAQAHRLYTSRFVGGAVYVPNGPDGAGGQRQRAYWTNPDDLYAQDWGWFATALYADALPNLWNA